MADIEAAGITHVGQKRRGNEDALFLDDSRRLYVVADGMGGHQAGEVASALVVDTIRDYMGRFDEDGGVPEQTHADPRLSATASRLVTGIRIANRAVHDVAKSNASYRGMGSTVSAVMFTDQTLVAANVGDSPIYRIHGGRIDLISVTHNVITEQMSINPDAALTIGPQFKHMLTRAMGVEADVEADVVEIRYAPGDGVVISSDGLSDKVDPEEILGVVQSQPPARACQTLVDMANQRGGDDNITVITLKVRSAGDGRRGVWRSIADLLMPSKT